MTPGLLLSIAAASLALSVVVARPAPRLWLGAVLAGTGALLGACGLVLAGARPWTLRTGWSPGGQPIHLELDPLSAFFVALLALVGGAAALYLRDYWSDREHRQSGPWNRVWWTSFLLTSAGVLLVRNGLHFLICWELFALTSYFLITLERRPRAVRAAGWLYLAASHAGTLALFAFFALVAARTGSWELGSWRDHPELAPLFWIALLGFGVKAGLFPLHIWLPSAHANAPSHVSAILSGVGLKIGIYGLVRFSGWLPVPPAAGWVVMALGAVTAVLGIAFALPQNDLKRLLAYSSVENIGVIAIGLGGGLLGVTHADAPWGRLALAGALLHVWNHGVFKSLLFFGAGSVLHATGTREISRLGGLWRTMPWTAALFAVGAIAVGALPPLNGFVSEWLIYVGLFHAAAARSPAAAVAVPAAILLAITGALALATFVKAGAMLFLGAPRTAAARQAHEAGPWMRGPMAVLAAGCLVLGVAPFLVWPAVARVVGGWNDAWAGAPAPAPLASLVAPLLLAAALLGAALALWRRARRQGVVRGPTWDCGYAWPTARMQYTSGSFAEIGAGWFRWILLPERRVRRPRGFFPAEALRVERTPETVLERGLGPVARATLLVADLARRLQHGRLQAYIAYVVVGLGALATLVALGLSP